MPKWRTATVAELQREGILLVEDGNHGEYRPRPDEFVDHGVAFIRAADMDEGIILFDSASRINDQARQRIRKGVGAPGDVLLSHKGTVGKVALVPDDAPLFVCSPQTTFWRTLDPRVLDRKYLCAFLRSPGFQAQLATRAGETDMAPYVSLTSQRGLSVLLPPIQEQHAIAHILGTLDDKIELNHQMNKTLKAIGQAIFKRWFVDFEFPNEEGKPYKSSDGEMILHEVLKKEIPKEWKVSKIDDELRTVLGGTPDTSNKSYWEGGHIPWINSGSINEFPVIKPTAYITELGLNNSAAKLMPMKTVVLPFVISVGKEIKISITALEASGNQSVLGIIENDKIPSEYIYYWISYIKEDIYSWATGGAQQHINKNNVDNSPILIPENKTIELFKKLMSPIFERIIENSHEIQTLSKIRDYLLPKLMSGKIRVPFQREIGEA